MKAFLARLDWQHYLLLATLIVTTLGPGVVSVLTSDNLPKYATIASNLLALATGVLALLKQFVDADSDLNSTKCKGPPTGTGAACLLVLIAAGASFTPPSAYRLPPIGGLTGCSALSQLNVNTVIADMTAFVQSAEVADQVAVDAWNIAEPLIPAGQQASAIATEQQYQTAFQTATQAFTAAIAAAQAGQVQNWALLLAQVTSAVDDIVSLVNQFGGNAAATPAATPALATKLVLLKNAQLVIHRYHAP
jgi:hypothetical protein